MNHELKPQPLTKQAIEELKALVRDRLSRRDWWCFLPGIEGMETIKEIERQYYGAGKPEDFEEHILPFNKFGFFGFVFAFKRRMTAHQLSALLSSGPLDLQDSRPITSIDLLQHDVICLATPTEAVLLTNMFYRWIGVSND